MVCRNRDLETGFCVTHRIFFNTLVVPIPKTLLRQQQAGATRRGFFAHGFGAHQSIPFHPRRTFL